MTKLKVTLETDPKTKTIALTTQEEDGDAITTNCRATKLTPETHHHARLWLTAHFNAALEIIDEA